MSDEVKDLTARLGAVIRGTCNTIGCKNCDLKWEGGCSAVDLQNRLYDAEDRAAHPQGDGVAQEQEQPE